VADGTRPALDFRLLALDETPSTNLHALALAGSGEAGPLWVVARHQTQGRGRSGRAWAAVDGNLYASLLVVLDCPARVVHQLSLLAGVSVHDAIVAAAAFGRAASVDGLRLKWPNDVLIGSAKVAGILPESSTRAGGRLAVVVGIGLNLAGAPEGLGRAATHLGAHGLVLAPTDMVAHLHAAFARWLAAWRLGDGFAEIRTAWLDRAGAIGEPLTVNAGQGAVCGTFAGVDPDGALLLRKADGAVSRFTFGDVTVGGQLAGTDSQTGRFKA
jgi:BirA family biotin operon repressor/biotin-[acetyl-CoA-carboxylase] ligase